MSSELRTFINLRNSGDWDATRSFLRDSVSDLILRHILDAYILIDEEKFAEAQQLLDDCLANSDLPLIQRFGILVTQLHLFWTSKQISVMDDLEKQANQLLQDIDESEREEFIYWVALYYNIASKLVNRKGDMSKAEEYLKRSTQLFEQVGDHYAVIKSMINMSVIEKDRGNYKQLLKILFDALEMLRSLDSNDLTHKKLYYMTTGNIASTYLKTKKYDLALKYYQESEKLVTEIGTKTDYCVLLINLGAVTNEMEQYAEGHDYLDKAIELATEINNPFLLSYCYRNKASMHYSLKNIPQALTLFQQSLDLAREQDLKIVIASNLSNIGLIRAQQGNISGALQCYLEVIEIIDEDSGIFDPEFLETSYHALATVYARKGDFLQAEEYWQQRLQVTRRIGDERQIMIAIFSLYLVNKDLSQEDKMAAYLSEVRGLGEHSTNPGMKHLLVLANAIQMKEDEDHFPAIKLLESLLDHFATPSLVYGLNFQILTLYNLCELYLIQYRKTRSNKYLAKSSSTAERLFRLSRAQKLLVVEIESYLLRSKIEVLQHELTAARQLLIDALEFAKLHQLAQLEKEIRQEISSIIRGESLHPDVDELLEQTQILVFLRSKGGSRGSLPNFLRLFFVD